MQIEIALESDINEMVVLDALVIGDARRRKFIVPASKKYLLL